MPAVMSRGRNRRTISEINMVPFIDVMLVLLIIFMVTAPLITPSQIKLPSVKKAGPQALKPIEIRISKDGKLEIKAEGRTSSVALGQVGAQVKKLQGKTPAGGLAQPVVISADKSVRYETVVQVMNALQKNDVARVGLSVQTEP